MLKKTKLLALDVGDATIGVAVSDELGVTARGLFTLKRTSLKADTGKIMETVAGEGAGAVIVGLPINLDGSDSVQTQKVRDFAVKLENKFRGGGMSGVEIILFDERFSTKIAERVLIEADMSRKKRAEIIDMQAAVVILQDYLRCRESS
jgi:putative Holliday junction resolvase